MGPEIDNKSATDASYIDESVSFPHVTAVATGWTLDFMFVSLCRHFKEGKHDEFNETLSTFETKMYGLKIYLVLLNCTHTHKNLDGLFFYHVIHRFSPDVLFEEDSCVMPLMSAAKIWSKLEDTVADESLFKNITILLIVQVIILNILWGLCTQDERISRDVKLSTIVTQKETYHPFLLSFSFSRLLETVQSYLDAYLEKNPSDYLLKVQDQPQYVVDQQPVSKLHYVTPSKFSLVHKLSFLEYGNRLCCHSVLHFHRTKRKLLSTKITDVWKPDSCKKPLVSLRRMSKSGKFYFSSKWTPQLDKYLTDGVKRHGQGKWSRILLDYDFEGRSGTMLKDRWRVLMRAHKVG
uniref:Telomeric repeat binding factor (NIMA-interacting) 1 n=1 Tax=Dicentrarchus labrax TaxID=13489 RepID=A0A8C4GDE3_DICLA